jgi:hypothetical protein
MMHSTLRLSTLALPAAVLIALVSGCSATPTPSPQSSSPTGTSESASAPAFHGNFADEYQEAWEKSPNEAVRTILEDETITDQEWSQVMKTLETCLSENGISLSTYNPNGSYEVNVGEMNGDVANQKMGSCEEESGEAWIGSLYRAQTSNPNNIPATQLLTECMIRNGAVAPSYTEEQYLVDAPNLSFPFIDDHGFDIFDHCNTDFGYNK